MYGLLLEDPHTWWARLAWPLGDSEVLLKVAVGPSPGMKRLFRKYVQSGMLAGGCAVTGHGVKK